jgi:hypothetical protein
MLKASVLHNTNRTKQYRERERVSATAITDHACIVEGIESCLSFDIPAADALQTPSAHDVTLEMK